MRKCFRQSEKAGPTGDSSAGDMAAPDRGHAIWDSKDVAEGFFSEDLRERVTGLYGVAPTIDFVEIAQIVENSTS